MYLCTYFHSYYSNLYSWDVIKIQIIWDFKLLASKLTNHILTLRIYHIYDRKRFARARRET